MTSFGVEKGPDIRLELEENEHLLHVARFHWLVLARDMVFPVVVGVGAGLLALFRAVGGTFLATNTTGGNQLFDLPNVLFMALIIGLSIFWWRTQQNDLKLPRLARTIRTVLLLITIIGLAVLIVFRYGGGSVLYIDPFSTGRAGDTWNIVLIGITILCVLYILYLIRDWQENYLVITNMRVVLDEEEYLVQHRQQQILINDVQQVNVNANGYLNYWLGYGTIIVRSFSPRTLTYRFAPNPQQVQQIILGEVNKLRRQQEPDMLRQMINDQVYGEKPINPPAPAIKVRHGTNRLPSWFLPPNPIIDDQKGIVQWRPADIFVLIRISRPLLLFIALTIGCVLLARFGLFSGPQAFALWLPVLLICGGWAMWIRESYVHDVFILNRQEVIDVDRQPFGPESRRRAPLSAIQDISYDVGIWEFLLGYGDVIIETGGAAGGRFTFSHVPNPRDVQTTINDYMTDFKRRQKEAQVKDTLTLLKQYHVAQEEHGEVLHQDALMQELLSKTPRQDVSHHTIREALREDMITDVRREARAAARTELSRVLRQRVRQRRRRGASEEPS